MHTLKYEVGLSSGSGLPVSYNGPHRGPAADITIFQEVTKDMLINHSWVGLADGTYQGESDILIVPPRPYQDLTQIQQQFHRFLAHHRIIIKNFFVRMKSFSCLSSHWRHSLHLHEDVFHVIICSLTIDLLFRPLRQ